LTDPAPGPVLRTTRLRLVPCAPGDVDRLHALLTAPLVRRFLLDDSIVERPWVLGVIETSQASFASARWGLWCVETRDGADFVGLAGLRVSAGAVEPQLLYALDPKHWGRGFATEAAAAVAEYTFEELGWSELLASTDPPNLASIQVMERLGMRFLEAARAGGLPIVLYRLTPDRLRKNGAPRSR
jgi:RimJ/RimL family protein N-acetyltransferase